MKEEIAVKMFTTFRQHLEKIIDKDNNQASACETYYRDDPYSEELTRFAEELSCLIESSRREFENTMKFFKEQYKQIEEARNEIESIAKGIKELRDRKNHPKLNLANAPKSVTNIIQEESIVANKIENKARLSMQFNKKYDPSFWENPAPEVDFSGENVIKRSKRQALL